MPEGFRLFGPSRLFKYLTWASFVIGTAAFVLAASLWRKPDSGVAFGFDIVSVGLGTMALYYWGRAIYFFANGPDRLLVEIRNRFLRLGRCRRYATDRIQAVIIDDFGDLASMLGFRIDDQDLFLGELTSVEDVGEVAERIADFLQVPVQRRQQVR